MRRLLRYRVHIILIIGVSILSVVTVQAAPFHPSPLTEELGLALSEGRWQYRRISCQEIPIQIRVLSIEEEAELSRFIQDLEALAPDARNRAIINILRKPLEAEGAIPEESPCWFEKSGDALIVTPRGKSSVLGCVLGDPWGWLFQKRAEITLPAPEPIMAFAMEEPAASGGRRPVKLDFAWGTRPRAEANARNLDTIFNLYGRGKEELNDVILGEQADSWPGVALRIGEIPVDLALASLSTMFRHERGHMESAEMAGSRAHWVRDDDTENVTGIGNSSSRVGLTRSELKAREAGGVNAIESAVAWRRPQMFEGDNISWTQFPQWLVDKFNFVTYVLDNPKPSRMGPDESGTDMADYASMHGKDTGQDPDKVYSRLVSAALWSAVFDPMNYLAAKAYIYDHVYLGKDSIENPMPEILGRQWWMGTGAHLSEVGVFYLLDILSREPESGEILTVSAKLGEDSQGGVGAAYSNVKLAGDWLIGRAGFEVWLQRETAADGPKKLGGAITAGVELKLSANAGLSLDGGWKDKGEMLDQGPDAGLFGTAGTQLEF